MVEAERSLSQASTKYWVDVILTTALDCRRFDCEREALAFAQVHARLPNACAVVAYAYTPEGRTIIFDWSEEYEATKTSEARQSAEDHNGNRSS
jgi:hypothetical protein